MGKRSKYNGCCNSFNGMKNCCKNGFFRNCFGWFNPIRAGICGALLCSLLFFGVNFYGIVVISLLVFILILLC